MIRTRITRSPDSSGDSNASTQWANRTHLDDHPYPIDLARLEKTDLLHDVA